MKRTKRTSSSSSMVVGEDDIISKLPDALIIHILSFLPTEDAVRTSLLSKRWRPIWYSVPTLFFSKNTKWRQGNEDKLFEFYNNCLKYRKNVIVNSDITSFKLDIDGYYQTSKAGFVDKWLGFAVENKIKEICLSIGQEDLDDDDDDVIDYSEICYCLPKILGNARYLTILELNGVFLDTSYSFSFPSLKTLSMEDVYHLPTAKEDGVVKFLLGCPSLERLWLHDYKFLGIDSHHRLQSLSLKFMEIVFESFMNDAQIQVEAMNLESLVVECNIFDMIDFSSCKKIRNLSLVDVYIGNEYLSSFEALISNIPLIENLVLSKCDLLQSEHLTISSPHLKSFHIKNCDYSDDGDEMKVVTIEHASKLAYICYEGNLNFTILMEPSNLLNGKIIIRKRLEDYGAKWFIDMLTFLVNLSCYWNSVTLEVANCKSLIWPKNLKNLNLCRYPLLNWKHLRVITDCKPEEESDLKEDLMWISPSLETLSINEKVIF